MRHYFWILSIAVQLSICGACNSEPEQVIIFLEDSQWEDIAKNVTLIPMVGHVDVTMNKMPPECKEQLERRMKARCARPASGHDLKLAGFEGCSFLCRGYQQDGKVTVEQRVALVNGTPCGPRGERCYNGNCVSKRPETTCSMSFVPLVWPEPGYVWPTTKTVNNRLKKT
uniref:Putative ixostatin n=1 Tax=Ixodes ricinus TaxID=34613 RepID=A0A0K8R348_IXORI